MTTTTDGGLGWGPTFQTFTDRGQFMKELEEPWTITLDQGLPTQRQFTMSLNLGDLPTTDLTPPIITFPLDHSANVSLTPIFQFTTPSKLGVAAKLYHFKNGITVDQLGFNAGTAQWSPPAPLLPGTEYVFDLRSLAKLT